MDLNEHLSEVQHSEPSSDAVRAAAFVPADIELEPLIIETPGDVEELAEKYLALRIPKDHINLFSSQLLAARNSWFMKAGELGLIYLTDVIPRYKGDLHFVFWDGKLGKDRREAVRKALHLAFEDFALQRVTAVAPALNVPYCNSLRKIGFVHEGTIRRGWVDEDGYHDALLFGMLKEELK